MNTSLKISVIITAGGTSSRFGSNKLLEVINGKSVIQTTIDKFLNHCNQIVIPTDDKVRAKVEKNSKITFVQSGKTRQESVYNALIACDNPDYVLIHDGARPFVDEKIIKNTIKEVILKKAVVVGVPAIDTVKVCDADGKILSTPKRSTLFYAQTPQAFDFPTISKVHQALRTENFTDDASMMEFLGHSVYLIKGSYKNKKITVPEDLA